MHDSHDFQNSCIICTIIAYNRVLQVHNRATGTRHDRWLTTRIILCDLTNKILAKQRDQRGSSALLFCSSMESSHFWQSVLHMAVYKTLFLDF